MKKLFFAAVLLFAAQITFAQEDFIFPKDSDYPKLKTEGSTLEDFVPKSWEIMDKTFGDLNGDGQADCVIVVNGTSEKFIQKHDGFGTNPFDTNPAILAVLLKDKVGYRLALQNNSLASPPEGPTSSYPFASMSIKRQVLEINFEHWQSAGGWGATYSSLKFKLIGGEFKMIGADSREFMRNSGEGEERSYDFLTRKIKVVTGDMMEYNPKKMKTRWRILPAKVKAPTLRTVGKSGSWEIERDFFL
ncbi:MAG TPA: hypothetical protein VGO50_18235 [Pyrinomonadaceae bacterium]|jgi:hypothetical protein|nr:hypothetical protein [Pyrinomonadaceae bacterium]